MSENEDPQEDGGDCLWPDDLEIGDKVEFDGDEYEVIGTGIAEATIEGLDGVGYIGIVFRWASTDAVGIELKTDISQEEFGEAVTKETDP